MAKKTAPAVEPLVVRPAEAFRLLGVGKTLGFKLLKDGRLERVRLGERAIGITVASIRKFAEVRIAMPTPEPSRFKRPRS